MNQGGLTCGLSGTDFVQVLMQNLSVSARRTYGPQPSARYATNGNRVQNCTRESKTRTDSKPKVEPIQIIKKYKVGGIHAVSALYELCTASQYQLDLKETVTPSNVQGFYFAFCAIIEGIEYKTGLGTNKKDARARAAQLALEELIPIVEKEAEAPSLPDKVALPPGPVMERNIPRPVFQSSSKAYVRNPMDERISQAVKEQFFKLMENYSMYSFYGSSIAAFVIETCEGIETVAVGTGDFNTKEKATSNGRLLHDVHALVTARRSLLRYLYRQLLMFFCKKQVLVEKSVFQQNKTTGLLCLKNNTSIHLYLNQLPKGAAQIPVDLRLNPHSFAAWEVNNQIGLHVVIEGKVFSVLASLEQPASRLISMSASDKLTQWQVLGFQGALLSHFIEPVYVSSILVGDAACRSVRGLEIVLNQRVNGVTCKLPTHYCASRVHVGLVETVHAVGTASYCTLSLNWAQGDHALEVVDGLEGRTTEDSPFKSGPGLASRLCKAAMLSRFMLVVKEAEREELLGVLSYRDAKVMSKSYQEAKSVLKSHFAQKGFGSWVAKSPVSDCFSV